MQICQDCARPTDDLACTCHHPDDAVEDVMRCELRDIDESLAPPPAHDTPCVAVDPPPPAPKPRSVAVDPPPPALEPRSVAVAARPPAPEPRSLAVDARPPAVEPRSVAVDPPPPALEPPSIAVDPLPVTASPSTPLDPAQGSPERGRATASAKAASPSKRGHVAVIATVFLAGGVGLVISRPSLRPESPTVNASINPALTPSIEPVRSTDVPPANRRPAMQVNVSSAPKWVRTPQAWATDGSRIVGVQLAAENDVRVWMKHVRPVLAVRCLARQIEVFVITDAATSIESVPDQHTVHVSFDGQKEGDERWVDSESKRELFAPDAGAFADRLSRARTMQFGFTPYGAQPVVADFDVHGFERPSCDAPRTKAASRVAYRGGR